MARLQKTVTDLKRTLPGLAENLSLCIVAKAGNGRYRDLIREVDIED